MIQKIKTLQTIHIAICAGIIVAYFVEGDITMAIFKVPSINSTNLVYLGIPVLAVFLSNFLFNAQLKQVNPKASVEDKLALYQTASIIRWAIIEGAAFVILFVQPSLILFGLLLILYLVILRPTKEKILKDLDVTF